MLMVSYSAADRGNRGQKELGESRKIRRVAVLASCQKFVPLVRLWRERVRTRSDLRQLAQLDEGLLEDAGLTRSQLLYEASKLFWRK
jgi:uncharacterized protein YjiS (DUF1127 family)